MGCWNGTCGITSLPIIAGEPIVCCLVLGAFGDSHENITVTCGEERCLTSPFFRGTYDEYGCVENVNDDDAEFIVQKIFDKKETLEDICRLAERGKLLSDDNRMVGLWMAHEDVFDDVCRKMNEIYEPYKCTVPSFRAMELVRVMFSAQGVVHHATNCTQNVTKMLEILGRDWKEISALEFFLNGIRRSWSGRHSGAGSQATLNQCYDVFLDVFSHKLKALKEREEYQLY